jgi:hypothetical protein
MRVIFAADDPVARTIPSAVLEEPGHDARHAASLVRVIAAATALLAAGPRIADGQSAIYGAGLQAWVGCWSAEPWGARAESAPPIVCIAPTADRNVATVHAVHDGRIVARETLDASGRPRAIDADRCTGTRSASWSRDGRRLFVRSSARCAGVLSSTSGILTITTDGDWLDVEGISAGGGTSVRVARYREVAAPSALPADVRAVLRAQSLATRSVRLASAAPVRAEDVLEAARAVDSTVLEAWILERGQRFEIEPGDVGALTTAGVPARIADALAAVADPEPYALVRGGEERADAVGSSAYSDTYGAPLGWGWGYILPGSRYRRGHRDTWRYGHYRPPLVIVRDHDGRPRGRGEHGRGGHRRGDDRDGRDGRRGGAERPRDAGPPAGDPRRPATGDPRRAEPAPAPPPAGATVRLGRPRG